jgi:hypothetical protein
MRLASVKRVGRAAAGVASNALSGLLRAAETGQRGAAIVFPAGMRRIHPKAGNRRVRRAFRAERDGQ